MRNNGPVTQHERVLHDAEVIVSKTDLKGNITYANQDFINVCGYSYQELIGSPQSIVRHPDMPCEAFADLWQTIKMGRVWKGLVKNRCKNGDYYWVEANVAPLVENGKVVGYTSIRVKAAREQTDQAEQIYRRIREGERGLGVCGGNVVRGRQLRWLAALRDASLSVRLATGVGITSLLFAALLVCLLQQWRVAGVLVALAGLVSALAGWRMVRDCAVRPLHQLRRDLELMSDGDLTHHIDVQGCLEAVQAQQALRVVQTNVKLLIGQIKEATGAVALGAQEIAAGNAQIFSRTELQAGSLEQTAATMEQLTGAVRQNASHADHAAGLVNSAVQIATAGDDAVARMTRDMDSIAQSAQRIVDIIAMIDNIAFQTNILALNAAVEAARAGEQGRGFAVVASEVRALAQRSAAAAGEIKRLIQNAAQAVDSGGNAVADAGRVMQSMVQSVNEVAQHMDHIHGASREQSHGITQVSEAVMRLDEMTQHNAAATEQAVAVAGGMREQAERLEALVDRFKLVRGEPARLCLAA